jgi:hypothetical protein
MISYGTLGWAGMAMDVGTAMYSHGQAVAKDKATIAQYEAQVKMNNALAARNYQLINEQKVVTMAANGLDSFEIAKEIRRNKAAIIAKRGGGGSLASGALQASIANAQRQGSDSIYRKQFNLGRAMRNLDIEIDNVGINLSSINNQARNAVSLSSSATGTVLNILKTGMNTFQTKAFKLNPANNKMEYVGMDGLAGMGKIDSGELTKLNPAIAYHDNSEYEDQS